MNLTDEEIKQLIRRYEKRLIRDRENYQRVKDDPEFIKQNRERASNYYYANKEKKKQQYQDNKEIIKAKNMLRYWKQHNKDLSELETKHPENYKILKDRGLLI
tara:strand:- start:5200 stop:5508 length:309 start_codon:yes stop_codon:yes gene_type:complete